MSNDNSVAKRTGFYTATPAVKNAAAEPSFNIDSMLEHIAEEIDDDYVQDKACPPDIASLDAVDASHPFKHVSLSFVSQQNKIQKISQLFTYQKQLGVGASCRVLLVTEKEKHAMPYALKELPKSALLNRLLFAQEFKVLNMLQGHPNIISFHSCYIDRSCYYITTQFCSGGTMLDRILRQKYFNEQQCSEFMKNVLFGIEHMHKHNIVHRDIKCENLIFDKTGKDGAVKIIDFGNSESITNPKAIDKALVGSLHYLPPELLQTTEPRTKASLYKGDMWALGVVCYILLTGAVPFYGKNKEQTLKSIRRGTYGWPQNIQLSDSCKDFISKLLEKDIGKRMSVGEALANEWISDTAETPDINFGDEHLNQIQVFLRANKLQKILLNAILSEMDHNDQQVLQQALRDVDSKGTGKISEHQVIDYILCHGKVGEEESEKEKARLFISQVHSSQHGAQPFTDRKASTGQLQKGGLEINLETLSIDGLLSEIDRDMEQKSQIEHGDDDDDKYEDEDIVDVYRMSDDDDDGVDNYEEDSTPESVFPATSISTKISVDRFVKIMANADKEYDTRSLVDKLQPTKSGFIPLKNISGFNGAVHSVHSNNALLKDFVNSGLAILETCSDDDATETQLNQK